MVRHNVNFTLPERTLGSSNIEFTIKRDNEAFGRLKVSNGTIVWVSKNKTYGFKLDQLMEKEAEYEKP